MNTYRIAYTQTEVRAAYVDAESESAARQCWIDGDFDADTEFLEYLDDMELLHVDVVSDPVSRIQRIAAVAKWVDEVIPLMVSLGSERRVLGEMTLGELVALAPQHGLTVPEHVVEYLADPQAGTTPTGGLSAARSDVE